jgi:hypothetical protein
MALTLLLKVSLHHSKGLSTVPCWELMKRSNQKKVGGHHLQEAVGPGMGHKGSGSTDVLRGED